MFGPAFFVSLAAAESTVSFSSSCQAFFNIALSPSHTAPVLNAPLVICFVDNSLEAGLVGSASFLIPVPAHVLALPTILTVEFIEFPSSFTLGSCAFPGVMSPLRFKCLVASDPKHAASLLLFDPAESPPDSVHFPYVLVALEVFETAVVLGPFAAKTIQKFPLAFGSSSAPSEGLLALLFKGSLLSFGSFLSLFVSFSTPFKSFQAQPVAVFTSYACLILAAAITLFPQYFSCSRDA